MHSIKFVLPYYLAPTVDSSQPVEKYRAGKWVATYVEARHAELRMDVNL